MLMIIMSDKVIARFQSLLESSLQKNDFDPDQTAQILKAATGHFRAIARANPLKPLRLPDTGLDVAGALNKVRKSDKNSKNAISLNPAILFEHHGLSVPKQPDCDETFIEEIPKKIQTKTSSTSVSTPRLELNIAEIISAAKFIFQNHQLRPDVSKGIIEEGPLAGTKWLSLSTKITNDTNFRMTEGLKSLSQIFDIGMIGLKRKPCSPRKARESFENAFNRAATHLGKRYTTSSASKEKDDSPKRKIPFVFQMLEESIIESSASSGVKLKDSTIIDKGPLSGMNLKVSDLQDLFIAARNKSSDFPFNSYNDFLADRNIWQKVSQRMEQRGLDIK